MIYADPDSQFVLIDNTSSVQLILALLMITYGLNRIFRCAQFDTVTGIVGTMVLTLYFSETNTISLN
jgi:hypothetical protein